MNQYEIAVLDAKIGIKAFQNIAGAQQAFGRFIELLPANDAVLLAALFAHGVVKYGKPFSETKDFRGQRKYKIKPLKAEPGFDLAMHEHLLQLRDTLIAHDDLRQIEPKVLVGGMTHNESGSFIPTSVAVSNKCIAYPTDPATAQKFLAHIGGVALGVCKQLNTDIARIRVTALANPAEAKASEKYQQNYGQAVPDANGRMTLPPFILNSWLSPVAPSFSEIHEGFHYEEVRVAREFVGPERIALPNGHILEMQPSPFP